MAASDDPVTGGAVTGTGQLETFPLVINGREQKVKTGGKTLEIFIRSGDATFLLSPLNKTDWEFAIREHKPQK